MIYTRLHLFNISFQTNYHMGMGQLSPKRFTDVGFDPNSSLANECFILFPDFFIPSSPYIAPLFGTTIHYKFLDQPRFQKVYLKCKEQINALIVVLPELFLIKLKLFLLFIHLMTKCIIFTNFMDQFFFSNIA